MYACVYIYSQKTVIHIHTPKEKKTKIMQFINS